ncbi:MAG: O-antigen ligase family protein [Planctomycetota bacterium]
MNRGRIAACCLGAMLACLVARTLGITEPMPGWDRTPLSGVSAITGIGPTLYVGLDALVVLFAAGLVLARRGPLAWPGIAALVGSVLIVWRTIWLDRGDIEPVPVSAAWASGCAAFSAGISLAGRPALRRFAVVSFLGVAVILLAKSAGQLAFEHPGVVATFDADPEGVLEARGYTPGSAAALQFERRLRQPDLTAWFGLSNVLAAYLVASTAALGLIVWRARRRLTHPVVVVLAAAGIACGLGVVLTGSKAGIAVLVALLACLVVAGLVPHRLRGIVTVGVWLVPVAAVVARGVTGLPEGELSLQFRWFYMQTAAEIAAADLPWGTGADGFRARYAVLKPPIAPESVTSSHHALLDWLAMLGLVGLPIVAVWSWTAWALGASVRLRSIGPVIRLPDRSLILRMAGVLAVPVAFGAYLEAQATTPEIALTRLVGLALGIAVAVAAWSARAGSLAAAAAGLALLMHSQLDMVLFHPGSIPLAMFAVGLGASGACRSARSGPHRSTRAPVRRGVALVCLAGAAVGLGMLAASTWRWEAPLRRAFAQEQRSVAISASFDATGSDAAGSNWAARAEFGEAVRLADEHLAEAARAAPRDPRAWLALASLRGAAGAPLAEAFAAAEQAVQAERSPRTLGRQARLAERLASADPSVGESRRTELIDTARRLWREAAELDRHGPFFPALLARIESDQGDARSAARWAQEALRRDDNYRLDPLAGLPERERARCEELVKRGETGG